MYTRDGDIIVNTDNFDYNIVNVADPGWIGKFLDVDATHIQTVTATCCDGSSNNGKCGANPSGGSGGSAGSGGDADAHDKASNDKPKECGISGGAVAGIVSCSHRRTVQTEQDSVLRRLFQA